MIFPIWQPLAHSSHQLAHKVGQLLGEPTTHTGTLDPMAEGVLVLLTGEDRRAKGSFSDWTKTYQFEILWGIATDSLDQLGLLTAAPLSQPTLQQVKTATRNFPSSYIQSQPLFSAQRWQGQSGFDWGKKEQRIPTQTNAVQLSDFNFLGSRTLILDQILIHHHHSLTSLPGDFRQSAIIESWKQLRIHNNTVTPLLLTTHQVTTSARTYIRQLVQDVAIMINHPALTWRITRLSNGPYAQSDCLDWADLSHLGLNPMP